ncbi:hypothetical protein CEE37_08725 [candidate division LCP-89 bacterium B3_LCP]|uniref:Uncharacterized protein n=1 Tax=candidate division LCP-89 bacterium B3_LCP TaxID=2012998 RepID=A0A532UZK8_UNCL8|nr:MAG: hypothetical protein CEE37_08725 [candidate division LCP-89 bacterium B3_LCP]
MACSVCNSKAGYQAGFAGRGSPMPCSFCGASGKQIRETKDGKVIVIECAHCEGKGTCRN